MLKERFALAVGDGGGDGIGFALVFVNHFHLHVADQLFGLHAAAVGIFILKRDHGYGGIALGKADILDQALTVLHGEIGGIADIALGGQRGASLAELGKMVF